MKALVLAAGRGSRLKNFTDEKPKCMYDFAGKPLLQWQYDALKEYFDKIGVVVGYRAEKVDIQGIEKIEIPEGSLIFVRKNQAVIKISAKLYPKRISDRSGYGFGICNPKTNITNYFLLPLLPLLCR